VPSRLLETRWALTPPFHPYRALSPSATRLRALLSGRPKVFLPMATEAHCTGGLFSVALSVAESLQRTFARRANNQPPGVTRRVALWSEASRAGRLSSSGAGAKTTVSGLSSRPVFLRKQTQRSPGLPAEESISSIPARLSVWRAGKARLERAIKLWNIEEGC
jgi:hypothetical protein